MKEYKNLQKKLAQIKMENEILKISYSHICKKTIKEISTFITKYQNEYTVKLMCKVLKINRSTYYKQLHYVPSNRALEKIELDSEIQNIFYNSKKRYDAPKIHQLLI